MRAQVRDETGVAKFRHEAVAVVLSVRIIDDAATLCALSYRRSREPFVGMQALPSGAVEVDETIDESVARHLRHKVGVDRLAYLEQLGTTSDPGRDPAERTIATAYLGLIPADHKLDLATAASWVPVESVPRLAFDHGDLVLDARSRLRAKLSYTNVGFALAPAAFTIAELRDVYTAALGHPVSATNLQRVLDRRGQLVETGALAETGAKGGRPARRFRFVANQLEITDPFAVLKQSG